MSLIGLKERFKRIPLVGKLAVWCVALVKMPVRLRTIEERLVVLGDRAAQAAQAPPRPPRQAVYVGEHTALATFRGVKMYVDTRDISVAPHLMMDGNWEGWITKAFLEAVRPGMTVVDVGANVGYYTILAAQASGPGGKVYAFEPEPRNFELLRRSVDVNGFTGRVVSVSKAVTESSGSARLHLAGGDHGASHSLYGELAEGSRGDLAVATTSLDEFLPAGARVDVVKIDAEGAEPRIFAGMRRVLADNPDIILIVEFAQGHLRKAGHDPAAFLAEIRKAGFALKRITTEGAVAPTSVEHVLGPQVFETLFLQKKA